MGNLKEMFKAQLNSQIQTPQTMLSGLVGSRAPSQSQMDDHRASQDQDDWGETWEYGDEHAEEDDDVPVPRPQVVAVAILPMMAETKKEEQSK